MNRVMNKIADIYVDIGIPKNAKDTISTLIDQIKHRHVTQFVIDDLQTKYDTLGKAKK